MLYTLLCVFVHSLSLNVEILNAKINDMEKHSSKEQHIISHVAYYFQHKILFPLSIFHERLAEFIKPYICHE